MAKAVFERLWVESFLKKSNSTKDTVYYQIAIFHHIKGNKTSF